MKPSSSRWWHEAVVYTIWWRSFADGNGDGVGDAAGIIAHLDDLAWLGVDAIWLTPIHPSPNADWGYDVADYLAIAPEFGDEATFERLIDEAHRRGIRVLLDLVINHTSVEHPWFRAAAAGRDPYRSWYFWREEPNNWTSIFGGPAWQWCEVAQRYYLHLFLPEQPDLNWDEPAVRREFAQIARHWLERGVDGFRFDALTVLKKAPGLPSAQESPPWDRVLAQPGLEALFADFVAQSGLTRDHLTLGEANGLTAERAAAWIGEPGGMLSALLHFEHWHLEAPRADGTPTLDTTRFSDTTLRWYRTARTAGTVAAIYLENHDTARVLTRFSHPSRAPRDARAYAAALLRQPGIVVLYQGQELGLPNATLRDWAQITDRFDRARAEALRAEGWSDAQILAELSRTGRSAVRTPLPWDADATYGGFSAVAPWTPLDAQHLPLAWRQQQADPGSVLNVYRRLIAAKHRRRAQNPQASPSRAMN